MKNSKKSMDLLLQALQERAKELNCLYLVEEILNRPDEPLVNIYPKIIEALPPHWQYPDVCEAQLSIEDETWRTPGFKATPWIQHADVVVQERPIGRLSVVYVREMPAESDGPFLEEETKLITTVAERLGHFINHQRVKVLLQDVVCTKQGWDQLVPDGIAVEVRQITMDTLTTAEMFRHRLLKLNLPGIRL